MFLTSSDKCSFLIAVPYAGSHISWIDGSLAHGSQTLILTDAGKLALGIRNNDGSTLQMKEEQPSLEMKSEETGKAETSDKAASPRKKVSCRSNGYCGNFMSRLIQAAERILTKERNCRKFVYF